ncbi:MAG TPA: alpha/beta fold hydrolase [Candidatus Limnocylindria bacterium]|nr:alpha/beta fold hydrolase [Candidatus Limnocylindria bacterium]
MTATSFAETNGVRLAYDLAGDGPPVVLLHAGIVDRRMWDDVVPLLADMATVIRFDARGFGESSRAPDGEYARWEDLFAVMDAAGVERAHLVGVSQGAETALDAALTAPDRVDHLVLCGAGLRGWPFRDELNARWKAEVEAWERGDLDGCAEESMVTWFDGPQRLAIEVDPAIRRRAWEMQRLAIDLENDDAKAISPEPPASERLAEVKAPTLVTVGALDQPDMVAIAETLAAGIPDARHVVLPGVAHLPPMERPAEFATLLRGFLAA